MMTSFVAFIRGIGPTNPNMRAQVLRHTFINQGFSNVASVRGTGNIIFSAPFKSTGMMETVIHDMLRKHLKLDNAVIVRTEKEIRGLIEFSPFSQIKNSPTSQRNITFLQKSVPKIEPHTDASFQVLGGNKNTIWSTSNATVQGTPVLMSYLEKTYGKNITTRTWDTLQRIIQKCDQLAK